jgi:hypothetical protein
VNVFAGAHPFFLGADDGMIQRAPGDVDPVF